MKDLQNSKSGLLINSGSSRTLWRNNLVLLFSLCIMIFILPVLPSEDYLLSRILLAVIVISGLFAAEFSRRIFKILVGLGSIVILMIAVNLVFTDSKNIDALSLILNTFFFIAVTVALITHVAKAETVSRSTLVLAVNSYLLIGLTASILFIILDLLVPESFPQIDFGPGSFSAFIYFGFVTLTTLGYGDITPAVPLARSLATFTTLIGQLYLVIIMAFIIGKFLNTKGTDQKME